MTVLSKVAIVKVQQDVREPYLGENAGGRPYEIVSFLGDGKLYVGSAGVEAALRGNADVMDTLVEGADFCSVTDLNISKFKNSNDPVFDTVRMLRRGQLVRVTMSSEHVIGNQRKVWRDTVVDVELVGLAVDNGSHARK